MLDKLPCDGAYLHPNAMIVKAFDGSIKEVIVEYKIAYTNGAIYFSESVPGDGYTLSL